jgi:hypothetical protein
VLIVLTTSLSDCRNVKPNLKDRHDKECQLIFICVIPVVCNYPPSLADCQLTV